MNIKNSTITAVCALCLLGAGCAGKVRSISNTAPQNSWSPDGIAESRSDSAFVYRGELSEFDVLGITRSDTTSESEIQRALDSAKQVRLRPHSSILLIQSGATFPDGAMVTELQKNFAVVPFSGIPQLRQCRNGVTTESPDAESYSKSLRFAAARGGDDFIICYWGILESENEHLATKTVSWIPVVRWAVPDERQHMRIRVKVALMDVRSGNWTIFSPEPIESRRLSTSPRREVVDQKQIERLKQEAYELTAKDLIAQHSDLALAKLPGEVVLRRHARSPDKRLESARGRAFHRCMEAGSLKPPARLNEQG